MTNIFKDVVKGLEWLGKKILTVGEWFPRIVKLADDVEGDTTKVLPELQTVVEDVDALAVASVKDGGADISALESLLAEVATEGAEITSGNWAGAAGTSPALVAAFQAFVAQVGNTQNFANLLALWKKLVADYNALGVSAEAALKKLETDATS